MQLNAESGPSGKSPAQSGNDNCAMVRKGFGLRADLVMALRFFSRLPTGDSLHEKPDLNRIALALPFASIIIGVGPALLLMVASLLGLPGNFAAAIAVAAFVLVTGAMADDALADSADGLFGGSSRERRLEIMKDSRHGTYGVCALCLFLLLRVLALGSVVAVNPLGAGAIWLASTVIARSGALWLAVALPPAREFGVSATAGVVKKRCFAGGAVFALIIAFVFAAPATTIMAFGMAVVVAALVVLGWKALCQQLVSGQTGDLIGGLIALIELSVLTVFLLFV